MKQYISKLAIPVALTVAMLGCANTKPTNSGESTTQNAAAEFKNISAGEFAKIKKDENAIVVDVRTPAEIAEGYITGATVFADINGNNFESEIGKLDKNRTYIVYCRSGARSSRASEYMINNGFTKVYNLSGGISNWPGDVTKP